MSDCNNFVARQLEPFITEACKADSMRSTPGLGACSPKIESDGFWQLPNTCSKPPHVNSNWHFASYLYKF